MLQVLYGLKTDLVNQYELTKVRIVGTKKKKKCSSKVKYCEEKKEKNLL